MQKKNKFDKYFKFSYNKYMTNYNMGTVSSSSFLTTTGTDASVSYVVNNSTRQKREKINPKINFSPYKPNEYKKYIIENYDSVYDVDVGLNKTFYFKNIWICSIYYDYLSKEFIDIKPRRQLCRLSKTIGVNNTTIDYVENVRDFDNVLKIKNCNFSSKKIKKCFTEDEANNQYIFLRNEYLKKLNEDQDKINSFINR